MAVFAGALPGSDYQMVVDTLKRDRDCAQSGMCDRGPRVGLTDRIPPYACPAARARESQYNEIFF